MNKFGFEINFYRINGIRQDLHVNPEKSCKSCKKVALELCNR
jgi:hypothetical protein